MQRMVSTACIKHSDQDGSPCSRALVQQHEYAIKCMLEHKHNSLAVMSSGHFTSALDFAKDFCDTECSTACLDRHTQQVMPEKSVLVAAVHLESAAGSMSYSQMKHPSLPNLGLRKGLKHVQFVHDDNPQEALEGGWLNSLLGMFHPGGLVMRRLDEVRVVLCLYELVMLPLRLAFGTGYGLIDAYRCAHCSYCWMHCLGCPLGLSFGGVGKS